MKNEIQLRTRLKVLESDAAILENKKEESFNRIKAEWDDKKLFDLIREQKHIADKFNAISLAIGFIKWVLEDGPAIITTKDKEQIIEWVLNKETDNDTKTK